MAKAVPMKGGGSKFTVDKCMEFIDEMGTARGDVVVKSDEPAIHLLTIVD